MQVNFNVAVANASEVLGDMTEKTTVATCLMKLVHVSVEFPCCKVLIIYKIYQDFQQGFYLFILAGFLTLLPCIASSST